jgi:hypothetical protein
MSFIQVGICQKIIAPGVLLLLFAFRRSRLYFQFMQLPCYPIGSSDWDTKCGGRLVWVTG